MIYIIIAYGILVLYTLKAVMLPWQHSRELATLQINAQVEDCMCKEEEKEPKRISIWATGGRRRDNATA